MSDAAPAPKILLIEDEPCTGTIYRKMLHDAGYHVTWCPNGESAVHRLTDENFDLVIVDLMMPKVDGIQLLKLMRTMDDHVLTPVIVVTAAKLKLVEDEAYRYGARFFLEKGEHNKLLGYVQQIMTERDQKEPTKLRMAPVSRSRPSPPSPLTINPAPDSTVGPSL